jgi:hypothetical protein
VTLALGMELSTAVDMVIDGVMPITIGRSYYPWTAFIKNAALASSLGHGWIFSYDWIVYVDPARVRCDWCFPATPAASPSPARAPIPTRRRTTCASAARNWSPGRVGWAGRLKFKDGRTWMFRQIGFVSWLSEQRDANGNVLRIERDDSGRPTTISAPGKRVSIAIDDSSGLIRWCAMPRGARCATTTSDDRLTTVTAPDGGVTSYSYVKPPEPRVVWTAAGSGGGGGGAVASTSSYPNRADGPIYIGSISRPGTAQPLALDYSESFRVLRQHSTNWDVRFAYELNGTCAVRGAAGHGGCAGAGGPRKTRSRTARPAGSSSAAKWSRPGFMMPAARAIRSASTRQGSARADRR